MLPLPFFLFVHLVLVKRAGIQLSKARGNGIVMPMTACKNVYLLIARFFLPGKVPCLQDPPWSMKQSGCNVHFLCEHTVSVSQPKIVSLSVLAVGLLGKHSEF